MATLRPQTRGGEVLTAIYPVILCGGSGTRLWPASRADRPKQFLKLIGAYSSFQETILRVMDLPGAREIVVVTGAGHGRAGSRAGRWSWAPSITVIIEPEARDSAPAVAAAAAYVESVRPGRCDADAGGRPSHRRTGGCSAKRRWWPPRRRAGLIVTFGVLPTGPATGFGYIKPGEPVGAAWRVAAFVEKPDLETARRYVAEGYYWNSGNFAFTATTLLDELAVRTVVDPRRRRSVVDAVAGRAWVRLHLDRRHSRDHQDLARLRGDGAHRQRRRGAGRLHWSDLGAWDAIWGASPQDGEGNAAKATSHLMDTKRRAGPLDRAVRRRDRRRGPDDRRRTDAVLVCRRDDAQAVKSLVDVLKAKGRDIAQRHANAVSGGVERQPVTDTDHASAEVRRSGAMAPVAVRACRQLHQVLDGELVVGAGDLAAGERRT
jgi:mannose-1-phosphate guanylyltransferase